MKKWLVVCLCALLCVPFSALAKLPDEPAASVTANGVVKSANVYSITAPFSGVLLPFDHQNGDEAQAGDVLFEMDTVKVYAPADGTIRALFAQEGDLCEDVILQYGKIAGLEKKQSFVIAATTSGAYDDEENRIIHTGETVYFEQTNDRDNEGEGRVVDVRGDSYRVEIFAGNFEVDDSVKIYRDAKMGTKTCIGSGDVARAEEIGLVASGRVLRCHVHEGQQVKQGQLLFELARADAETDVTDALIRTQHAGALEVMQIFSGMQVYKGQLLAKVHDLETMNVVAEVDEMDMDLIHVGDTLSVAFDRYPGQRASGTVTEIARMGVAKQNATYYDVTLSVSASAELLPGMNATVYLSEGK